MTKKKIRFKSKFKAVLRDLLILVLCTSVCAVSLRLFWKDLNSSSTRSDKDAIATITFKYKVAQRKFTDRVVWERLQNNSPLYNEDTIRTSDFASATITFAGGEVLEVHENSMVQILQSENGGVILNVSGGGIDVDTSASKTNAALAIQTENGGTISVEGGSRLAARTENGGDLSLQLRSGTGSIFDSGDSESEVLISAGETIKLHRGGEVEKFSLSVTSISDDLWLLNTEDKPLPVHLEWQASEKGNIVVQTSRTKDFSKIESSFKVSDLNSVDIPASDGTVFWRIFEEDDEAQAVSGKIRVSSVENISLSSPKDNSEIRYSLAQPSVTFSWTGNDFADYYRLEVSETPDFSVPIFVKNVQTLNFTSAPLEEGSYFWRVTPYYSKNNLGFTEPTETAHFSVAKRKMLSEPVPVSPSESATLFYVDDSLSTTFRWKTGVEDGQYRLLVSDSEDFSNIIYERTLNECHISASFTKEQLPPDAYYWKVSQTSYETAENIDSACKKFNVALYVPEQNRLVYPPDNFSVFEEDIYNTVFDWKVSDELKYSDRIVSEFQVSDTQNFDKILFTQKTELNQLENINLLGGKYFWRIALYPFSSSKENAVYTDVRSFNVLKSPDDVAFLSPSENETIMVSPVRPVKISWQQVENADYYNVKLINASTKELVQELKQVKNTYAVFDLNPIAKNGAGFECSVQPVIEQTDYTGMRRGNTSSRKFSVRQAQRVSMLGPKENVQISGLEAIRNPVVFTWQEGIDAAAKSEFILQKLQPNGNYKTLWTVENPEKAVSLENLLEGSYRWKINAGMVDGTSLNAPDYAYFVITPVPELNLPVLMEPAEAFVMNEQFLRKNRNLRFKWQEVPGATDYTFALYKKNADGKLKTVDVQKTGNSCEAKFKNLKLLDIGEFEWQVTAYSINKNGMEEQHSKVSRGTFRIDFGLPGAITTKDPGEIFVE